MQQLLLPSLAATPEEARAYVSLLLVQNHGFTPLEASKLVKKWQHGKGADMRRFQAGAYCEIFGPEIGSWLFLGLLP